MSGPALTAAEVERAHLCPLCNGRPLLVGCYGAVTIMRCRDCGEGYSTTEPVNAGVFTDE